MATTPPRFFVLCDENTSWALVRALRGLEPAMDVLKVGEPTAPPLGTPDPDLLIQAEAMGRVLITHDRNSMVGLLTHFGAGRHVAGVILLRGRHSDGVYAREVVKQWNATTADDWIDRTIYVP